MSEKWQATDILDLVGKVAIVTGANSGIGYETALSLATKGAHVILACRNVAKGNKAQRDIQQAVPHALVTIAELDLSSLQSVRTFATQFLTQYDRLDLLINNAGIMSRRYLTTTEGFESQMGVNHLGHFALTGLLMDLLNKTPAARIVNVSSGAHKMGALDFANLNYEGGKEFSPFRAYGGSKLANLYSTYELQRRLEAAGLTTLSVAAHPGGSRTNIGHDPQSNFFSKLFGALFMRLGQSAAMGALPTLRAAVDPEVKGGEYYGPDGFMEQRGYPVLVDSSETARDETAAQKLWELSVELTDVDFAVLIAS